MREPVIRNRYASSTSRFDADGAGVFCGVLFIDANVLLADQVGFHPVTSRLGPGPMLRRLGSPRQPGPLMTPFRGLMLPLIGTPQPGLSWPLDTPDQGIGCQWDAGRLDGDKSAGAIV